MKLTTARDNVYVLSLLKKGNTVLFGLIASIFLTRALGPGGKGEYMSIINVITLLSSILFLGISSVYPNYIRNKRNWTVATFWALVFVQGIACAVISIIVYCYTKSIDYFLYGMCLSVSVVSMQALQMSIIDDFKRGTIANIISVVINALLLLQF